VPKPALKKFCKDAETFAELLFDKVTVKGAINLSLRAVQRS
jgi:hypothetical protein